MFSANEFAKGTAVKRAKAVFFEHFVMQFRTIALVPVKTILGKFFVKIKHVMVAPCLGNNGGGRNEWDFFVAPDDCLLKIIFRRE